MNSCLPLLYHPSSVLLLDDDPKLLNRLSTRIDKKFPSVLQENPQKALAHLKSHCLKITDFSATIIEESAEISHNKEEQSIETYDIDFSAIRGNLTSHLRFEKTMVAVVDRHIPAMDGLEFCRLVKETFQLPIKIILLTGATTSDQAVKAFNDNVIDGFIQKNAGSAMMIQELNQSINALAWQQFQETSRHLAGILSHKIRHLSNEHFIKTFEDIREKHQIIEFYLYNSSGSFLMLDANGNASMFVVRTNEDFMMMHEIASSSGASQQVLEGLEHRKIFPLSELNDMKITLENQAWSDAMITMQGISGTNVFYNVVPVSDWSTIATPISFHHYVHDIWANQHLFTQKP